MKKAIAIGILGLLLAIPVISLAQVQGGASFGNLNAAVDSISVFIGKLIPLVIGIAVLMFLIGLIQYVTAGGDEEKKQAARGTIIYGIIVLFVMVGVWGFVKILTSTFFAGSDPATAPFYPQVPRQGQSQPR